MNESTQLIGPLMRAARKFKKLNQADVARAIGCSQSALSKMEHNLLVPSAPQWFLFARFTSIPPESIELGYINRHSEVKFNNNEISLGFRLPRKYRLFRAEKVRELYPFLLYLEKLVPPQKEAFIKHTSINPEFFMDFDNLVSFQLILDLIDYFLSQGKGSEADIKEMVRLGQDDIYWNGLFSKHVRQLSFKELLKEFIQNQIFFQVDFKLKLETVDDHLMVSYFPASYMMKNAFHVSLKQSEFLNLYRKLTLENLVERALGRKTKITLISEAASPSLGARFEIEQAA